MPRLTLSERSISRSTSPEDGADDIPASIPPTQPKKEDEDESEETKDQPDQPAVATAKKKSSKNGKRERPKREQKAETPQESVNGDEDDAEEFAVEMIVDHRFKGKKCTYKVRWEGYTEADDTWEPEDNFLPESAILLGKYHESIGGAPQPPKQVRKSGSRAALNEDHNGADSPPAKRTKMSHRTASKTLHPESAEWKSQPIGTWTPSNNTSSWEDLVHEVETVERDDDGNLHAFIRFRNGQRSKVANNIYIMRCPRALLKFYESHLNFSSWS